MNYYYYRITNLKNRSKSILKQTIFQIKQLIFIIKKQTRMNNLRNRVQLIGNLGQAPEIISFDNGKKLAKVVMATNETYKNASGEKVTETQWHNLIAWGKTADIIEKYVQKGQEIAIEGKIMNKSYETKEGEKRYKTEIQIQELMLRNKINQKPETKTKVSKSKKSN